MREKSGRKRGMVLMVTLLILCVLGILVVSFTLLSGQDYRVARQEEWGIRAFYLARSGFSYYASNEMGMPSGTVRRIPIESSSGKDYCEISVRENEVLSRGMVMSESGEELHSITLTAPYGDTSRWYEAGK